MMTRYVTSVEETPSIPSMTGTWPADTAIADPVINDATAGIEMRSTSHPNRSNPMAKMMIPQIKVRHDIKASGDIFNFCTDSATIVPMTTDVTATGPIFMSFEVPNIQYMSEPMKELYSPYSTGTCASFAYAIDCARSDQI